MHSSSSGSGNKGKDTQPRTVEELLPWTKKPKPERDKNRQRSIAKEQFYDSSSDEDEGDTTPMTDEQVALAFQTLSEMRARWIDDDLMFDWKVTLLGGAWTQLHKGQAADVFRGSVKEGTRAEQFAIRYNLGRSSSYSIEFHDGFHNSQVLAREYCRKCQFFFDQWCAQPNPHYVFSPGDINAYHHTAEYRAVLTELRGRALTRATALQNLFPHE